MTEGGPCRLCGCESAAPAGGDKRRSFYLCGGCGMVSVPQRYWLSADDERKRYALHDNSAANGGYVRFLSQVAGEAARIYAPGMNVLDFGCGEEAVLCRLLNENGINCRGYDPLYQRPLPDAAAGTYDIIILCEVIEHLRDLRAELELTGGLLRDGGAVIVRTQVYDDLPSFSNWWYAQDPTHINFFARRSLEKAAGIINRRLLGTGHSDIFVMAP